jgi:rhodanese-related sulfurtransferase
VKGMKTRWLLAAVLVGLLIPAAAACGSTGQAASDTTEAVSPSSSTAAADTFETVDIGTASERLKVEKDAQIVDVREPSEWVATGVPPGAKLIPLGEVEKRALAELDKDKPVYVICNSGNRSRTASAILVKLGFAQVYNVDGGIKAWIKAGLPVEAYQP